MVAETDSFKWQYVKDAFSDWQIYLGLWASLIHLKWSVLSF